MRIWGILLLWGLVEIALFAWVGGKIGVLNTLGLVIFSAIIGVSMIRRMNRRESLRQMVANIQNGVPAGAEIAAQIIKVIAAILLLLPGFFTDLLALLLLLLPVRILLPIVLGSRLKPRGGRSHSAAPPFTTTPPPSASKGTPQTLEGEFTRDDR